MHIRRCLIALFVTAAAPLLAQSEPPGLTCGTDAGDSMYVSAMHRANAPRLARMRAESAPPRVEVRNGMFVVEKTPENALLDHPNDLEGKSVRLEPDGPDRYHATVLPLQYDSNIGTAVHLFANNGAPDWPYVKVTLKSVKLPLFGQAVDTIYVTAFNSITLSPPRGTSAVQYDTLEASFVEEPTVAPLLMTASHPGGMNWPTAYLREWEGGVVVTWRAVGDFSYDVQAKIANTGEITFSYRALGVVTWGAVLVTPGASAFLSRLTTTAQLDDVADDVAADAPVSARAALDIRSVALQQVAGTGGYLLAIFTGASGPMRPPRGDSMVVSVTFGDAPPIQMMLLWNGSVLTAQTGRSSRRTATAWVDGNQILIGFTVDVLRPIAASTHMVIETSLASMSVPADRLVADVPLRDGEVPGVDVAASNGGELALPIVDAFTWPTVDLESVWESVRSAASLDDTQIDGVAIFQNFHSDVTIANIAFATMGNPQADGISKFATRDASHPRSPNLMNLNDLAYGNLTPLEGGRIVLHEFGHRWLQFVETMENGTATLTLNPAPAHPPQFASAPAAFPVVNPYDTSTMGGGFFAQNGNTFTSSTRSPYGYSWLDLYLMGLAAPDEVPAMYVIDNSSPPLGYSYNPPSGITVSGVRHDVTIQQVIDAMGPRRVSAASNERTFKVVFVMLSAPGHDADADLAHLDAVRRAFADNFAKATGNRAAVQTLIFPPPPSRRRAARP